MKKFILIFAAFYFLIPFSNGQGYEVKWGPKIASKTFRAYQLIGMTDNHFYVMEQNRKNATLLKYNLDAELVKETDLDLRFKNKTIEFDRLITTKNGIYAYLNLWDRREKKWNILVSKFDEKKPFEKVRRIYNHDYKYGASFFNSYDNDIANAMVPSQDSNYVAYANVLKINKAQFKEESIQVAVFDADMNKVWDKTQGLGFQDRKTNILQISVSNNGVIYLVATVENGKRTGFLKGQRDFDLVIFRITEKGAKNFTVKLGNKGKPNSAGIYFPYPDEPEKFVVTGFYTDMDSKLGLKGVFFSSADMTKGTSDFKTHEFDRAFLEDLNNIVFLNKKKKGVMRPYNIKHYIDYEDGTLGFIAEETYITTTTTRSGNTTTTSYVYHTDNLIIPKFTLDGDLVHVEKIIKNYDSGSPRLTSFSFAETGGKMILIFPEDKGLRQMGDTGRFALNYTDIAVLNQDGKIESQENLFIKNDAKLNYIPSLFSYSDEYLIIGGFSRFKIGFGTVKLK